MNNWRLNNKLLNDQWVIEEITEEIRRFLETHENENNTYQNQWDTAKAILKRKFIALKKTIQIINKKNSLFFRKNKQDLQAPGKSD
jgi:hypothetical protein